MKDTDPSTLYLGKFYNPASKSLEDKPLFLESKHLTTHAVCVGMTGSGKTGLGIALLEEIALKGIPAIVIDPKGDLGNLLLTFPQLRPVDFLPWIDAGEAERHGKSPESYAAEVANNWKEGLKAWGEGSERIAAFQSAVDRVIYTPANRAGIPLSIMSSFAAPGEETLKDAGALRERILSTTTSLLGLLGIEADPINSREHILISTLMERSWKEKKDLDLSLLIQQIQKPPFDRIGIVDMDSFYPQKERNALALRLNNLLASPGFQAWMEGEPLDIQNLLYTKDRKPRLSILTIAHLSDAERMFFVTLFLNELLSWMRRQTGSSSLRALLYMDEIFGFFPPSAMPSSKVPMLTLLKQARAYGLGIMLATQNPVDLDYKGLSNCGLWFIGKLQTERDKKRVLEGLGAAHLEKLIASCGNRTFILRSVYATDPLLFQTRWALSYLRGPLTLPQIEILMAGKKQGPAQGTIRAMPKQSLGMDVEEFFIALPPSSSYVPKLIGIAKLHFVDAKKDVDTWTQVAIVAPVDVRGKPLWEEQGEPIDLSSIQKGSPSNVHLSDIPGPLMQAKNYVQFGKSFAEYLYQNQTYDLLESKEANIVSDPNETEEDFRKRASSVLHEQSSAKIQRIRDRYDDKINMLEEKIKRAEEKAATRHKQWWRQIFDTAVSFITTILGALLGKGITKGSVSSAGTTLRKAERISREQATLSQAQESLESLKEQLQELQIEMEKAISELEEEKLVIEKCLIRPRKGDISVQTVGLIWVAA